MKRSIRIVADDAYEVGAFSNCLNNLGGIIAGANVVGGIPAADSTPFQLIPEQLGHMSISVRRIA